MNTIKLVSLCTLQDVLINKQRKLKLSHFTFFFQTASPIFFALIWHDQKCVGPYGNESKIKIRFCNVIFVHIKYFGSATASDSFTNSQSLNFTNILNKQQNESFLLICCFIFIKKSDWLKNL